MATGSGPVTESIEGGLVEGIMEELRNNGVMMIPTKVSINLH